MMRLIGWEIKKRWQSYLCAAILKIQGKQFRVIVEYDKYAGNNESCQRNGETMCHLLVWHDDKGWLAHSSGTVVNGIDTDIPDEERLNGQSSTISARAAYDPSYYAEDAAYIAAKACDAFFDMNVEECKAQIAALFPTIEKN